MYKVLIIEDEFHIRQIIKDYFSLKGIEVVEATQGYEALSMINETIDLILLDIMMPGIDGYEVCKQLRLTTKRPVIFMSALSQEENQLLAYQLGADDYISKPFSPSELVARVKAHMNRYERLTTSGASNYGPVFTVGDLEVHVDSRRVIRNQKEIVMANKEFDLLAFLIENPDVVFSKETLFDRIWGMEPMGETSTVTVHINRIREKIEPDPSNPRYIETVWGVGYRFCK